MKLIVQIPCLNEAETLPLVLRSIPASIPGIEVIETLVIDDGSTDGTAEIARREGVDHIIRNRSNLGLAQSFRRGIEESLLRGADIVVNMDGDNQYKGEEIEKLIEPIIQGRADLVVGDRQTDQIPHFTPLKRILQKIGSAVVRRLSGTEVRDTVSGFRAFSREAAIKLTILSYYSYTLESILQARFKGLTLSNVTIQTNPKTRESRLMRNLRSYLTFSGATIIRVFTMYNPLRVFLQIGIPLLLLGVLADIRFIYYLITEGGRGHVQSLILGAVLSLSGVFVILAGLLADLIQFNRRLLEEAVERLRRLELKVASKDDAIS